LKTRGILDISEAESAWRKFFWTIVGKLVDGIYLASIEDVNANIKLYGK
jgi:hypothetical protein